MGSFSEWNPAVQLIYFLAVSGVAMFCMNPVLLVLSLLGAVSLWLLRNGTKGMRANAAFAALFLLTALLNPLFSHNGVTVLFILNDNPVTLEAVWYGLAAGTMLTAVLYWFRSFSQLMTSDRLLYLFGRMSPKFALLVSMVLRYVPLFGLQAKKIQSAQTGLGFYKEDNLPDRIRGGGRVFSVLVTWALENGIVTADSMAARGWGTGRRTSFALFRFRRTDALRAAVCAGLFTVTLCGIGSGALRFSYYPAVSAQPDSLLSVISYIAYGILSLLPTITEAEEKVKWHYLRSKI